MIIDMEHHAATSELLYTGKSASGKICERYWDTDGKMKIRTYEDAGRVEKRLQFMDESGIDMAALSPNPMSTLEQCRKWNDFCAGIVQTYPNRFVGFASVPPLGSESSLTELSRAVNDLGLKGVHIWTQTEGYSLDSREMWPFYERVAHLGIPIDVHVTLDPHGFDGLHAPYALYYVMARELDMCAATMRVCLGGVLEDFPDLIMIMNHFGGGVSAVMERLDAYMNYVGPGCPSLYRDRPLISKPWRYYFDKLYFNMAGREAGMAAVKAALTTISPKRLMFGTDWPYNYDHEPQEVKRYMREIRQLSLPPEDIEGMLGRNAARVLGIQS
jgi:predicted TIM-barrel fold metal-dependent hydrolase